MALRQYHQKEYPNQLRALPFPLQAIDQRYHRANANELQALMQKITALGIDANNPAIEGINADTPHAAQKWIAEKKKQIVDEIHIHPQGFTDNDFAMLGINPRSGGSGGIIIRQSGNLTRIAAALYNQTQLKQQISANSKQRKEQRAIDLADNPLARANLKQLRYAERPLRNEIYELEQVDRSEYPEVDEFLHPHKLNYRLPSTNTMDEIKAQNAIPQYPNNVRIPAYVRNYYDQQQVRRQIPENFLYQYSVPRKGKAGLPRHVVDMLVNANVPAQYINDVRRRYKVNPNHAIQIANRYLNQAYQPEAQRNYENVRALAIPALQQV